MYWLLVYLIGLFFFFFFFSSRRRHTRLTCDWSSDVCSSDLGLELVDELLDALGRDWVERGCGLVEEQDLGLDRDRARDAEALLLTAREAEPALLELVLDLVPERGTAERRFDALVQLCRRQFLVELDAEGDIVVDRHGERRRLLEHHADLGAQQVEVFLAVEDVAAVD